MTPVILRYAMEKFQSERATAFHSLMLDAALKDGARAHGRSDIQMQRPLPDEYAAGYQKYLDLVPEGDFFALLKQDLIETVAFFEDLPDEKLNYKYAEGKWTIKEVFMHVIDTERVFSYRGLAAARGDPSQHYRMDEELYAASVNVSGRSLESLITEFKAVRASTEQLYPHITDAQSKLRCNIVTHPMTARAIGYFLLGHVRHHMNIIKERYL